MEPQNSKIEVKVGVFVAIGLIGAMVSILLLGGNFLTFKQQTSFHTRFNEVSGLVPGSIVSLSGLRIGNIKSIALADDFKLDVVLNIDPKYAGRITDGAVAEVKTQGALGDKYIFIKPGPPGGKVLEDGAMLPSDETDFLKLLTDRDDGMARAVDLIKELHILVAGLNQEGKTARMMSNMTDASEKLKTSLTKLDSLLSDIHGQGADDKKLKKALTSLANVLEKIDKGQGSLGQLINDPSVHQSLKNLLGPSPRGRFMKDMVRETIRSND
ncbi:MAG: MlaD family protein [Bdellovibrionales bacterium]|jgi:phospholipid/cholesterol/gamma-HCH transport system substrate-binding protein|nr:MlaD family protein [Bdellovibrionales bacterium]